MTPARFFTIAADVAMGIMLGLFVYAALMTIWPRLQTLPAALITVTVCVLIVLFRRPHGSLAKHDQR